MSHRFLIAPDPAAPGSFYAERIGTHERFRVPGPRITAEELRSIVDPYPQMDLDGAIIDLVEHPASDTPDDVHTLNGDSWTCLEPGCLTPAALYCSDHRHQLTSVDF